MIREATVDDISQAAALFKGLGYNVTQKQLDERLRVFINSGDHHLLVDDQENTLNGIIGVQVLSPFHTRSTIGRISTLVFDESYRGNQSGKQLLLAAERYFQEKGCGSVEVSVGLVRTNALPVLKAQGYVSGDSFFSKRFKSV